MSYYSNSTSTYIYAGVTCSIGARPRAMIAISAHSTIDMYRAVLLILAGTTDTSLARHSATGHVATPCSSGQGPCCTVQSKLGCFVDADTARVLPNGMKAPTAPASLETCASLVAAKVGVPRMSSTLLGVEAGKQCWWGANNSLKTSTARPASECGTPCSGNSSETCGGEWRVAVFTATCSAWTPPPPPPPPPPPLPSVRTIVFRAGDCDEHGECYPCFRIPALKRAKSGALLAFAEVRAKRLYCTFLFGLYGRSSDTSVVL